ncbi:putative cytoplasmic protein [Vibrio owensii]|uniref:Cytoplasmic protein n=1 Tax=Vibrio owensii TaxID=696485 RepID=A0AAU9PYF4_9VIBR|nr:putative cytoplasmic protein [Vibrio owensii]
MNKAQMSELQDRLDLIQPKFQSEEFLSNKGLGNEIGFYIFDYAPEAELLVNEQLEMICQRLEKRGRKFVHLNLFDVLLEMLDSRKLLEKAFQLHKVKGDEALLKALKGPLDQKRVAEFLIKKIEPINQDFVLLSGLGSCWPLLRGHSLLNALHADMGETPLVLFYPGSYTGLELHPFGKIDSANYYRAFELVPHKKSSI